MVNRVLQAKAMKRQRQIRKLPRVYLDPVGEFTEHSGTPIPARLKAEGVRASMQPVRELLAGYKHRAKSLEKDEAPTRFLGRSPGRKEVFDRLLEMQFARVQSLVNSSVGFVILNTSVHWAKVFRNSTNTAFVILYINFKEGVMRTSMSYVSRKNCIDDFHSNKTRWVEFKAFI